MDIEFNRGLKLIAIEKETGKIYEVDGIFLPLGKPSGKDITVVSKEDPDVSEWRSINEVEIKRA